MNISPVLFKLFLIFINVNLGLKVFKLLFIIYQEVCFKLFSCCVKQILMLLKLFFYNRGQFFKEHNLFHNHSPILLFIHSINLFGKSIIRKHCLKLVLVKAFISPLLAALYSSCSVIAIITCISTTIIAIRTLLLTDDFFYVIFE